MERKKTAAMFAMFITWTLIAAALIEGAALFALIICILLVFKT